MRENGKLTRREFIGRSAVFGAAVISVPTLIEACGSSSGTGGQTITLSLAHGETATGSVNGYHGDTFKAKLESLSNGNIKVNLYPGGTLGDEPALIKKVISGDIDFCFAALNSVASVVPAAGIAQAHFLYASEAHLRKTLTDSNVNQAFRAMIAEKINTFETLGLYTEGTRNIYAKFPVKSLADVKNRKIRVTSSAVESAFWAAYGAVPAQLAFAQVYTSLQTGLVQMAENNVTAYLTEKHYEVAPVYSATEHESDLYTFLVSTKAWNKLSSQQKDLVQRAASETQPDVIDKGLQLWHDSLTKAQQSGAQYVTGVDKSGFQAIATQLTDPQAQKLGASAVALLSAIRKLA